MKPPLPQVCTHYDIRSPVFHLPDVKHSFAKQSINAEKSRMDIVHNTSFYNFKINIKHEMISTYSEACIIDDCYVCGRLN